MKRCISRTGAFALLAFLFAGATLSAQVDVSPSGYVTSSVYVEPAADTLLDAAGLRGALNLDGFVFDDLQFRLSLELFTNLAGLADDSAWADDLYYPGAYEGSWNERFLFDADLKEAWLSFAAGDFDIVAGKQLVTWGQADGTNPTDNVNARYIGTRQASTSAEKKLGSPMVNMTYNLSDNAGTVQGLFMPVSVPNRMPPMGGPITVEESAITPKNMEGGLRALLYPGAVSVSASWLTILDRYPSDVVETKPSPFAPGVTMPSVLGHNRQHIFGADAVWLVGGFDFRTEWAYTLTKDIEGTDPFEKNSFVSGVVQGSRSFFNGTTSVSLSWAPQYIVNFEKPVISNPFMSMLYVGQGFEFENMAGFRLQTKQLGETLQAEAMFLGALAARDWLSTASATYNLADGWNLKGGVNIYGSFRSASDPDRQLGPFGNDSAIDGDTVFLELRFDF